MKALISTIEIRETGYRVAQVVNDEQVFDVSLSFYWVPCDDTIIADEFWYNPTDNKFYALSFAEQVNEMANVEPMPQPVTSGTQTL